MRKTQHVKYRTLTTPTGTLGIALLMWAVGAAAPTRPIWAGVNATARLAVDLDPSTGGLQSARSFAVPTEFEVDLLAQGVSDLHGVNFNLSFDPARLEIVEVANQQVREGPFLASNATGDPTIFLATVDDSTINVSTSILGQNFGVDGDGVIAHVRFKAVASGESSLALSHVLFSDHNNERDDVSPRSVAGKVAAYGEVASFDVVASPQVPVEGEAQVTVTARDAEGNVNPDYTGTVQVTSSDPRATLPNDLVFTAADRGTQETQVTLRTAGVQTVTATDAGNPAVQGTSAGVRVVTLNAGSSWHLDLDPATEGLQPTRTVEEGTEFDLELYASGVQDLHGVHLDLTFDDAFLELVPVDGKPATEGPFLGANPSGAPTTFLATLTPGEGETLSVLNIATTILGEDPGVAGRGVIARVRFRARQGGNASLAMPQVVVSDRYGNTDDVSAKARGATVTIGEVPEPIVATRFLVSLQPESVVGEALPLTVTAVDEGGQTAVGYTGTAELTSSDPSATLPSTLEFQAEDAGVRMVEIAFNTIGIQKVTATDAGQGLTGTSSGTQVISRNRDAGLLIDLNPATEAIDTTLTVAEGMEFDAAVVANNVRDLHGINFDLTFDPALMEFVPQEGRPAQEADWLPAAGDTTFLAVVEGEVLNVATTLLGTDPGVSGSGAVARLRCRAKTRGTTALALTRAVLVDRYGNPDDISERVGSAHIGITAVSQLQVITPETATLGQPVFIGLKATDDDGILIANYEGTVTLTTTDEAATLPATVTFTAADGGQKSVPATFRTIGLQTVTATDEARGLTTTSPPFLVVGLSPRAVVALDLNSATDPVDSFRDADPDEEFEVALVASGVIDLHGIQVALTYDAAKLEVLPVGGRAAQEGPFLLLNEAAQPTFFIATQEQQGDLGRLDLSNTILGSQAGLDGTGVFARVRFRVRSMGASDLTVTSAIMAHRDNSTEDLTDNSIHGIVSVRDTVPPSIADLTPPDASFVWNNFKPTISARIADQVSGSGLDEKSLRMTLDGVFVTPSYDAATGLVSHTPPSELEQDVPHRVRLIVSDRDGNEAAATWSFTVSQRTPPRAAIALDPASPLRAGTVQIRLTASEKLADLPTLTFKPQGRPPVPITNLSTTDFVIFEGSFEVTPETGDGPAFFSFEGIDDQDGLVGNEITAGETFFIDTTPPAAGVSWNPPSPLSFGDATVTVTTTEDLVGTPTLTLTLEGQNPIDIPLTGAGSNWGGAWTVTDTTPNGAYTVAFRGRDAVGNVGTTVLQGSTLVVDTLPPDPPTVLRARVRSGGKVQLTWLPPVNEPVRFYRLYRSTTLPVLQQADHLIAETLAVGSTYLDTVFDDGTYHYAVSAVDFAGNEGSLSEPTTANTDQEPPRRPRSLTATVSDQQRVNLAWQPPAGEAPAYYTVYRSQADITAGNLSSATKVRSGLIATTFVDTPTSAGDLYYAVTASDAVGNEGPPSASARVAFDNVAPTAQIALSGEAVRTNGESMAGVGVVEVALTTSEDLAAEPTLRLEQADGTLLDLTLTGTGSSFTARFTIEATAPSGFYRFHFTGADATGNVGSVVTSGARFYVATQPPDPITVLTATPQGQGQVALSWVPPAIGDAFLTTFGNLTYRVYRDTAPLTALDPAQRITAEAIPEPSFTDTPPSDGTWYYAVTSVDPAGNEGPISLSVRVSPDRTAPGSPTNLRLSATRTLDLLWSPPAGEAVAGYHVYRNNTAITSPHPGLRLTSEPVESTEYHDFPPTTGTYFYAVTAVDDAGNESGVSNSPSLTFEQLEPVATITLAGPGVKREGTIPVVGFGELNLTLATSRALQELPSVTYQPAEEAAIPLSVSGSGTTFTATFQITPEVGNGVATFGFAGVGTNGVTGNTIIRGRKFLIDTIPPTGVVTLDHPSTLRPGTNAHLRLQMSESVPGIPALQWTDAEGRVNPVLLVGQDDDFRGSLHIPGGAPVGQAFFSLEATDFAGNQGTEITSGGLLTIVKSAPNPPVEPRAERRPNGTIYLTWERPIYEPPEIPQPLAGYYIYRHTAATVSTRKDYRVTIEAVTGNEWSDTPPDDGTYFYIITAINQAGMESLPSEIVFADSDRTPPTPPILDPPQTITQDTQVRLTWQPQGPETPVAFNVYRSTAEILTTVGWTPLNPEPLPHSEQHPLTEYIDTPPGDNTFFYAVTALDDLGQESPPSPNRQIDFVQPSARATIVLSRNGVPGLYFTQGEVDLVLTTDKPLLETPTLTFTPYGSLEPRPVDIYASGDRWEAQITIDQTIPDGEVQFAYAGITEVNGEPVAGSVILAGDRFWVDTSGPTADIEWEPSVPRTVEQVLTIQQQPRFDPLTGSQLPYIPGTQVVQDVKVQIKAGTFFVTVRTSEPLAGVPELFFIPEGGERVDVPVQQLEPRVWRGQVTIAPETGDGTALFFIKAPDAAGNIGEDITAGKVFIIDTDPPSRPSNFNAVTFPRGVVKLAWDVPFEPDVGRWLLYRSPGEFTDVSQLAPLKDINLQAFYSDNVKASGTYFYALVPVDTAGNTGPLSRLARADVDLTPPGPPQNLEVHLSPDGIIKLNWDPPSGDQPSVYNVYISTKGVITSTAGNAVLNQNVPFTEIYGVPNEDGHYWFAVTALDSNLNEGPVSDSVDLDYRFFPAVAKANVRGRLVNGWLAEGTFPVTLTTDKPLESLPTLTFTPLEGEAVDIPLEGVVPGTFFTGEMAITSAMQDGVGFFKFEGMVSGRRSKDIVEGEFFVVDKEAPPPPDGLTAVPNTTNKLGTILVGWKTPAGEIPQRYFLYRDTQPITSVEGLEPIHTEVVVFGNKADYEYEDRPPVDGVYHYAVVSGDLAGNTSAPTPSVSAEASSQIPTGSIVLRTEFSGEVPTAYVGEGTATVTLTTSKPVPEAPQLTVAPEGKEPIPLALTGGGNVWTGTFQVDPTTGDGVATFEMEATDAEGNSGNFISSGKQFTIVTTPPTAEITLRSNAVMVADVVDQQFKVKPLKVGRHGVMLRTDTPLAQPPQVTYTLPDGTEVNVPLQRGNEATVHGWIGVGGDDFLNDLPPKPAWFGFIDVGADTPNGTAVLSYAGVDQAGNRSDFIEPRRHMQAIRIETKVFGPDRGIPIAAYVTAGESFEIDTVSPPPPINMRLEVRKLGVAALFWDDDPAEQGRFYRVYRDLKPHERPDRGKIVSISGFGTDLTSQVAVDAPPMDGTWYYAATSLDLAGNESEVSESVHIFIDSKKPDLKITPLPGVDDPNALIIQVESAQPPSPEATVVLKFPGAPPIVRRLGDIPSGALQTEVVTKPDGTTTYIQRFQELFPMGIEVFDGTVEVVVYSPDASGVAPSEDTLAQLERAAASMQMAAQMVNEAVGGRVEFPDGSVTLEIPAGVRPIIPGSPHLDISPDRSNIFFISNVNIPQPGEATAPDPEEPPDRTRPGTLPPELVLIGKAYRIELNQRPQEPLRFFGSASQVGGAIQARGGLPRMQLRIPQEDLDRFQFTPEQLRQKLRVVKWNTEAKRWETVPPREYVVDPVTRTIEFPADEITTYVIVAERTPPAFHDFAPTESEPATTFRPQISCLVVDKGTGVDGDAIVMKVDGVIVPAEVDQRDPTEMKVEYTPPEDLEGEEHIVTVFARDIVENGTTREWRFLIDNQPPRITDLAPRAGALVGTGRPVISALLSDLTGIDFGSTVLTLDGAAVPVGDLRFDAASGRLAYTPSSILPSGEHTLNLTVYDRQNLSSTTGDWTFTIDEIDSDQPVIDERWPAPEEVIPTPQPEVRARLTDGISGIDPASIALTLDEIEVLPTFDAPSGKLTYTPEEALTAGDHLLSLEVKDQVGNVAREEWGFFVDSIAPVITNRTTIDTPLVEVNQPVLLLTVTDEGSGVDIGSIRVKLDGTQILGFDFDQSNGNLFFIPAEALEANEHSIEVAVADRAGNRASETMVLGRGGTLTGRVRLSARDQHSGAIVRLEGTTITATTAADGTFVIHNLPEGKYTVNIDRIGHKAEQVPVQVMLDETSDVGEIKLLAGDADDDGSIGPADVDLLQAAFGSMPPNLHWDERCDFNGDERINLRDFAVWVENQGR